MLPLPETIIALWVPLAPWFTKPVWGHAQGLLVGAILGRGPRTVAAARRVMGLGVERRFEVTFQESRRHLGVETQRPGSD